VRPAVLSEMPFRHSLNDLAMAQSVHVTGTSTQRWKEAAELTASQLKPWAKAHPAKQSEA
jgi:hypothetical protein